MKYYKSLAIILILVELLQAGGRTLHSDVHKLIFCI